MLAAGPLHEVVIVKRLAHQWNSTLLRGARRLQALLRPRSPRRFPRQLELALVPCAIPKIQIDECLIGDADINRATLDSTPSPRL